MSFADKAIKYFLNLNSSLKMPASISLVNPYQNPDVKETITLFYKKFFDDNNERVFVLGINPGRFGGGLTGISFTDPVALRNECGIENNFGQRKELSSEFIFSVIKEFGGVKKFYSKYFLSALFPIAILKEGKNYNYYDESQLLKSLLPGIADSVRAQIEFGAKRDTAVCLGKKNAKYFNEINSEYNFFGNIEVLEHPRYIMQYKRKSLGKYIGQYLGLLNNLV
jgi:hypothetical protein